MLILISGYPHMGGKTRRTERKEFDEQ